MRDENKNNKGIATIVLIIAIAIILFIEVGFVIYILFYSKETSDVNNFEETSNFIYKTDKIEDTPNQEFNNTKLETETYNNNGNTSLSNNEKQKIKDNMNKALDILHKELESENKIKETEEEINEKYLLNLDQYTIKINNDAKEGEEVISISWDQGYAIIGYDDDYTIDGKIIKNSNGYKVIPSTEIQY